MMMRKGIAFLALGMGLSGGGSAALAGALPPAELAALSTRLPPAYRGATGYSETGLADPADPAPQAFAEAADPLARSAAAAPVAALQQAFVHAIDGAAQRTEAQAGRLAPLFQPTDQGAATLGVALPGYHLRSALRRGFATGICADRACLAGTAPDFTLAPIPALTGRRPSTGSLTNLAAYEDRAEGRRSVSLLSGDVGPGQVDLMLGYFRKKHTKVPATLASDRYLQDCRAMPTLCGTAFAAAVHAPGQSADWQYHLAPDNNVVAAVVRDVSYRPALGNLVQPAHMGLKLRYRFH